MKRIIPLLLLLSFLAGCETMGGAWTKKSSIAFSEKSGGSLSIWNAEMSAAVAYDSGQICMQRALAVKTIDAEASVKISDTMLTLAKAVEKGVDKGR